MSAILKIKHWNTDRELHAIINLPAQATEEGFMYSFIDNNEIVNSVVSTVQAHQPHRDLVGV